MSPAAQPKSLCHSGVGESWPGAPAFRRCSVGSLGALHLHKGDSQVGFTVAQSQMGCLGALGTMGASLPPGLWQRAACC